MQGGACVGEGSCTTELRPAPGTRGANADWEVTAMLHELLLDTGCPDIDNAFRIAVGDLRGNIRPWAAGAGEPRSCILAGLDYGKPWTRDATLNAWFAGSLLVPEVARNTLMAVLTEDEHGLRIGGQYWDAIIWATGAWHHFLCTGDREFLSVAFSAVRNSIVFFEETEFDASDGLFRGGACFQDGVSGYPDRFADGPTSGILGWVTEHPAEKAPVGYGLPIKALSTNCLYYNAYGVLGWMAAALGETAQVSWAHKADRLRGAINDGFWNEHLGTYSYLLDAGDDRVRQEGFGHAFAVLFGIADAQRTALVLERQHVSDHGIPCVWPTYERYARPGDDSYGRHSGTVWPQVNTAWVMANCAHGRTACAWSELRMLAAKANRDAQFTEIYHPVTGEPYGGLQEGDGRGVGVHAWEPRRRQTWCATGYIRMVFEVLFGMRTDRDGLRFEPDGSSEPSSATLAGLRFHDAVVTVSVKRDTHGAGGVVVNGTRQASATVPADARGHYDLEILLSCPQEGSPGM